MQVHINISTFVAKFIYKSISKVQLDTLKSKPIYCDFVFELISKFSHKHEDIFQAIPYIGCHNVKQHWFTFEVIHVGHPPVQTLDRLHKSQRYKENCIDVKFLALLQFVSELLVSLLNVSFSWPLSYQWAYV